MVPVILIGELITRTGRIILQLLYFKSFRREILCFQTVNDPFFISAYNVFFTSMPIIMVGVFDKDVDTVASIRYGKLLNFVNKIFSPNF